MAEKFALFAAQSAKVADRQATRVAHMQGHSEIAKEQANIARAHANAANDSYNKANDAYHRVSRGDSPTERTVHEDEIYKQAVMAYNSHMNAQIQTEHVGSHRSPCRDLKSKTGCATRDTICNWRRDGCTARYRFWKGRYGDPDVWLNKYKL